MTDIRLFDLNIERILEAWDNSHAIREIIANALDEQTLSDSSEVEIVKSGDGAWTIRDYGRGLRYDHFTQNENAEKLAAAGQVIGKFGIGLKDAVATLTRNGASVEFESKHGVITFEQCPKHGFEDVVTLHAKVAPARTPSFKGTRVRFLGVNDAEVAAAKAFFLKFSGEHSVEETRLGAILKKRGAIGRIYIAGLLIAEEEHFAFSYNITSLTEAMRKALNRERTNVGRNAYSERVKAMLLQCQSEHVVQRLANELVALQTGGAADEIRWKDVAIHACKILNNNGKCVFVTSLQLSQNANAVDVARREGKQTVVVPDTIFHDLKDVSDFEGNPIRDLAVFQDEWNDAFEFEWVDPDQLTAKERSIFSQAPVIARLAGGLPKSVKAIRISKTMRRDFLSNVETVGVWNEDSGEIVVRRDQLRSLKGFAATLLHEIAHVSSGADDLSRDFEDQLTSILGTVAVSAITPARV